MTTAGRWGAGPVFQVVVWMKHSLKIPSLCPSSLGLGMTGSTKPRISLATTRNAASPSSPIPQHKSDSTKTCKWLLQVTQGLPGLAPENNRPYLLWGSCCSGHAGDLGSWCLHCIDENTNILHLKWLRFKVSGKVSFLLCLWSDVETPVSPEEAFPKEILLYPE